MPVVEHMISILESWLIRDHTAYGFTFLHICSVVYFSTSILIIFALSRLTVSSNPAVHYERVM